MSDDEFRKLEELRRQGLLTPREFKRARDRLYRGNRRPSWKGLPITMFIIAAVIATSAIVIKIVNDRNKEQLRLANDRAATQASAADASAAAAQASAAA